MNKNVNRDYLVKVNVKTAEIETPKDDMIFYVTDIWTSNIFFQLDFGKGNSLTDLHNENASDYDLTLRVVKPNKEHKEIKATLLSQDSNFFVADLKPDFTDYIGICECELFIETTINGRKETNTTDPFEYIVEGSVFSALDEIIEGRPDYPPLADKLATKEYVDAAVAAGGGGGSVDLTNLVVTNSISMGREEGNTVGNRSTAVGYRVIASHYSHAEGYQTTASGSSSHAEGQLTKATGDNSHAEGAGTKASGNSSHAEGQLTTASGEGSHAEGSETKASNYNSHAEGIHTTASGFGSHAEGRDTIAASDYQHVQGKYNIKDTENKYAHIVGNGKNIGSSDYLSNAYTLDWSGNGWYKGNIYVGGTSQDTGKKIATEEYVDNAVSGSVDLSGYVTTESMNTALAGKSDIGHSHDELHTHTNKDVLDGITAEKVASWDSSTGSSVDLSGYVTTEAMNTALSGKSNTNHTHSNYATSNNPNFTGTISGNDKFAVGKYVSATGNYSYAQGLGYEYYDDITEVYEEIYVLASGAASHAEGYGTQAKSSCQHVQGKLNIPDTSNRYAHIVGNGTDENSKSNAHTLDWNGNGWYKGNLYVGGTSQDNANKVLSTADIKFTSDGKLSVTINGVTKKFNPA